MPDKKSLVESLLEAPHSDDAHTILDVLADELDSIKDPKIASFVKSLLLKADAFWIAPSSFDHSNHPPDEWGLGGLVLHTKRVVRVALMLSNAFECSIQELDILTAAALLHDVTKAVMKTGSDDILHDTMHPYTVDAFVEHCKIEDETAANSIKPNAFEIDDESAAMILRLIHCSHGFWSPIPETIPISHLERTLHMADLVATHIHILADGFEVDEEKWKTK